MFSSLRDKPLYKPLIWLIAGICFLFLILIGMGSITNSSLSLGPDFVEYWAAGRLNISNGNPYNPNQMHLIQIQTGAIDDGVIMMWNPPWMLAIAMPLASVEYNFSQILWFIINIIIIFICINLVWDLYRGSKKYHWYAWIIGFTFAPILDGLKIGQTGALLLFGVIGFIYFLRRRSFWMAGVFLSLSTVKPHVIYLFLITAIIWSIDQKHWKIIIGFIVALGLATTLSWIVNPHVIEQYIFAVQNFPPSDWATPTFGGLLRIIFGTGRFWIQFIPLLLGLPWMIFYWLRNRNNWDWLEHTPILILISTLTAAYGWSWDQTVSIIAILQIAVLLFPLRKNLATSLIISSYVLIDILALTIRGNQLWTFWLAPSLLIWYLVSRRSIKVQPVPNQLKTL